MEEETTSFNKEIQNLLDNVENSGIGGGKSWRKYARLVLPHVGLVIFVCFYALLGAWVFYSIESPHEDRLKVQGVRRVQELRRQLVKDILGSKNAVAELGRPTWMGATENQLRKFGEDLFRAYKEQYVRFENVRPTASNATNATASSNGTSQAQPVVVAQLDPRFRRHFSKSRSEGKMWTPSSALFFAATTMATIGYGNIVPMTSQGRIACIIFALFGAPLAIITIGDLGKFLSECTIWMYRRIKDKSRLYHFQFRQFWISRRKRRRRRLKENFVADELAMDGDLEMGAEEEGNAEGKLKAKIGNSEKQKERDKRRVEEAERDRRMTEWEEEEKLETEVPVLVVFAILLFYIAFGGVLFAFLESWTYMDAFYYCFVSLTTIGFGDLVPDRHEYIVLMLLYLGIGLAVTTMCIDLVGVQYIQKIHYFGRKFKGTDIMQILKRKRMMERRFAMGEGKEFIEFVIKKQEMEMEIQNKAVLQPGVIHLASQLHAQEPQDEEKISLRSCEPEWPMEESVVQDVIPTNELALAQSLSIPEILEPTPIARRLSSPTVSPSSESERSTMYNRLLSGRIDSWTESGPSISLNSPLSTEPSVQQREEFYANYKSPEPSPTSFAFSFPPPSPDLWKIADAARSSRRLASCPALPPYPEPVSHQNPRLWRKWRTLACPSRAFHELLRFSKRCVVVVLPFQSLSRRFSRAQPWEPDEEENGHWPRLGTNGLGLGENGGEEAAAESIHHLDVLRRRVSFENQAEILQAPKAPPLRFISQPVWYYRRRRSLHQQQEGPTALPPAPPHSSAEQPNPATVPPIIHQKATIPLEAYQPILKRKRRERLARRFDPLLRFDWLALSPRIAVTEEGGRPATMEEISERAQELLKMEDLPKQLASEHPIYQHLANLESGTADLGSTSGFDQSQSGGTSSARLITGQAQRFSLESLALSLKAARRWKEQTRKRDSISSQGQGPSTSKNLLPQMKWLMKSQRRTSLGGGQISGFISKELTFGNGRKMKESIGTTALESPRRILGQSLEEEENSKRVKDKGEWRQMSMEVTGKKTPIRPKQRASVVEEIRIGAAGGSRGSRVSLGPPTALEEEESPKTGKKVGISGKQSSPSRQRASVAGSAETSSAGQRRQMSIIDIGAQKSPSPSRTRQRSSVAGAAGGSRGSIIPGGNEFRLKVPTKSTELPTTSKGLTMKGKPESKQQQQTKRPAGSKGEEANPSSEGK